jgi:hypothetical protein
MTVKKLLPLNDGQETFLSVDFERCSLLMAQIDRYRALNLWPYIPSLGTDMLKKKTKSPGRPTPGDDGWESKQDKQGT